MKPWSQTYNSAVFELPADPLAFSIKDIAHHLSMLCRYNGACRNFYSVAEHCVLMAGHFRRLGDLDNARYALMHDAAEAYLCDLPRPIKALLPEYNVLSKPLEDAIALWCGLETELPAVVRDADSRICLDERDQNMGKAPRDWGINGPPLGVKLMCWVPRQAEQSFLNQWSFLFPGHNGGAK